MISSDARFVVWPGVGAEVANMNYVVLEPGEENVPHTHDDSEDTIFCLEGRGTVSDLTNDARLEFEASQVIHVPAGVEHAVMADRGERIVSIGGPLPAGLEPAAPARLRLNRRRPPACFSSGCRLWPRSRLSCRERPVR